MPASRALVAEFIGTFALMFVGGAAIIVTQGSDSALLAVALAHGLILAVMVTATMHISGGQLNPAVSFALGLIGKQPWSQAVLFMATQIVGAITAAALLNFLFSFNSAIYNVEAVKLGATLGSLSTGDGAQAGVVLTLEAIAAFFLMFVIMGTAVDKRGVGGTAAVGGFAIGLTVAADILAIGPLTGASMNPARSFGPALVGGYWSMHWVYWVGPVLGMIAAAVVYQFVFSTGDKKDSV